MKETEALQRLKALAVDLDDTGVESGHRIEEYHQRVLGQLAVSPMPTLEKIQHLVGGPSQVVFEGLYPPQDIDEAKRLFGEIARSDPEPSRPIDGVSEALGSLTDMEVLYGWATNRRNLVLETIIAGGIDPDEAAFIYDGNFGPKSEALKDILQRLGKMGIQALNLAMVGDTDRDMHDAKKADGRILKVGIRKHAAEPEALERVADLTFHELPDFVEAIAAVKND